MTGPGYREVEGGLVVDCGCIYLWTKDKTFVARPCSPRCRNWHHAKSLMAREAKPTTFIDLGPEPKVP